MADFGEQTSRCVPVALGAFDFSEFIGVRSQRCEGSLCRKGVLCCGGFINRTNMHRQGIRMVLKEPLNVIIICENIVFIIKPGFK